MLKLHLQDLVWKRAFQEIKGQTKGRKMTDNVFLTPT